MANSAFDPEAKYAQLGERVDNQGIRIVNLEQAVARGFTDVNDQLKKFSDEWRNGQRPQWQAISFALAFAIAVGGLAYWPIRESLGEIKQDARELSANALSVAAFTDFKNTYENNRIVSRNEYIDKFSAVATTIGKLDDKIVPRQENERIWEMQNQQTSNLREALVNDRANLQRQIDELKQQQTGFFGQRDLNLRLLDRMDDIEKQTQRYRGQSTTTSP